MCPYCEKTLIDSKCPECRITFYPSIREKEIANDLRVYTKKDYPEIYQIWHGMIYRCRDSRNRNYGGRGITVCNRWKNSFSDFVKDMGPRPKGFSIDRINTNGNYEPSNCRWATQTTQANNTRRNKYLYPCI